jgi:signal transduction histidine kinase
VISLFDITERKNTEQVMLKLERLSTIGEMAAGMAHEIRNPLAAISMAAQLMKRKNTPGTETFLQTILEQSARLEQLVKDTLDYARIEKGAAVPSLSLKSALESALRLSQIQIGPSQEKVRVEWVHAASGDYAARAQSQRVQQIFINLILNAYQAMAEGGQLTLGLAEDGDKVLVRIADTGPGLPKKDFQRIFEPFFTTKGTGSGLGLAISQRIAVQYGGRITAERLKPHGMAFTLELPRAEGSPA